MCIVILMVLTINGAFCARLNDVGFVIKKTTYKTTLQSKFLYLPKEFSVGTNLNKYLDQDGDDDLAKRDGEKRTTALWFGPRLGKRLKAETFQFHMVKL